MRILTPWMSQKQGTFHWLLLLLPRFCKSISGLFEYENMIKKNLALASMHAVIIIIFFYTRASMIWIIGEYAERIDNADELLESFLEGFHDENTQVQLQLLTAIVKLFLKRPTDTQELVQQV